MSKQRTAAPGEVTGPAVEVSQEARLGRQIRQLRHEQGLTLVALAARTQLSHPFLSQVERGLARPSMTSLERIAQALRSSQSDLMARAAGAALTQPRTPFTVVRSDQGTVLPSAGGSARLLVDDGAHFHPMIYTGDNGGFDEYYQHVEDEFVHVVLGAIEVDLGGSGMVRLAAGDSLYYSGGTPHRWRTLDGSHYRLLAVKEAGHPGR